MAFTGLGLSGFLAAHLAGNLLVFKGQDAMNAYAVGLREIPMQGLWVLRIGLIAIFVLHVVTAFKLASQNRAARPEAYVFQNTIKATFRSRTMVQTGLLILAYVIYHLAHFTFHTIHVEPKIDALGRPDVYTMVVESFQQPVIAITYIVAMIILGMHVSHGLSSVFQTFGFNNSKYNGFMHSVGPVLGTLLSLGFISIPVGIWLGIVGL